MLLSRMFCGLGGAYLWLDTPPCFRAAWPMSVA